ncbi:enoyl-CoA hydratase 2, peroxisomal-like isoform X2 [Primulina huaijiensis]|uniref:enoyl-CoA hydratase 2, peroxisomal-like isoform X2 n=1 Tax=Primulina huaijiensis TaxID=1492673 RepID=UPI003CC71145
MAENSGIDPQRIISHEFPQTTFTYTERDAALYALGVGACSKDAVDDKELKYVYHQDGQQAIELLNKMSVTGLHDKGKAAILEMEILSYEKESSELLCMNRMAIYLRGAGGFSKSSQPYSFIKYPSSQNLAYQIPKTKPFAVFEECTQPSQALLYRLSGDYNPLHSDPMVAEIAGFSRPILHGLCSLGFAVRAIIKCICRGDQNMIKNISGKFLLHVYPGETLITEMWLDGLRVLYQVNVRERNKTVLSGAVSLTHLSSSL